MRAQLSLISKQRLELELVEGVIFGDHCRSQIRGRIAVTSPSFCATVHGSRQGEGE